MAILHNFSNALNPLSCFDPVSTQVDGTSIGHGYVLRRIFDALLTFDSNIKEITSGSPTPSFLQSGLNSTLPSGAAVGRATDGEYVSFYFANDPGLSEATPNAFVYRIKEVNATAVCPYQILVYHITSGGSLLTPSGTSYITYNGANINVNFFYAANLTGTTNTTMLNIPMVSFWKSDNCLTIQSFDKRTGSSVGVVSIFHPVWNGYERTTGAITNSTFRAVVFGNNGGGQTMYAPYQPLFESSYNTGVTSTAMLSSCGQTSPFLFNVSGGQELITGKLKISVMGTNFKVVSNEIEGVLLTNNSYQPYAGIAGTYSGVNYITGGYHSDGKYNYRHLLAMS